MPRERSGFAGESAGPPALTGAFRRNHKVITLSEASISRALEDVPANQFHGAVLRVSGHCCAGDETND